MTTHQCYLQRPLFQDSQTAQAPDSIPSKYSPELVAIGVESSLPYLWNGPFHQAYKHLLFKDAKLEARYLGT